MGHGPQWGTYQLFWVKLLDGVTFHLHQLVIDLPWPVLTNRRFFQSQSSSLRELVFSTKRMRIQSKTLIALGYMRFPNLHTLGSWNVRIKAHRVADLVQCGVIERFSREWPVIHQLGGPAKSIRILSLVLGNWFDNPVLSFARSDGQL